MAKFTITGLDEMRYKLQARGARVEGVINHMLNAGAKIMREEMQAAMQEYQLKDTGDMMKSVKSGKIQKTDTGKSISIAPSGIDRKGVPNAAKARIYEDGTSRIPARPWLTLAEERGKQRALDRMREIFLAEINEEGGGAET